MASKVFQDQIPPAGGRVYQLEQLAETGKYHITDVTQYEQEGTPWTADDANTVTNGLPPIGDITFGFYRISYPGGDVNAKTFPWVNFDDDLDPAVYPQLYALYGDSLSDGAGEGRFNLKKLADRFPLVSASNFGTTGGEEAHTLTTSEMPRHNHDALYKTGLSGGYYLHVFTPNSATDQSGTVYRAGDTIGKSGGGKAHNNMPPYIRICAHVRAG